MHLGSGAVLFLLLTIFQSCTPLSMGPKAKAPAPKPAATIAEVVAHLELLGHKDAAAEVLDKFGEGAVATSPWAAAAGSDGKLAVETRLVQGHAP